MEDPAQLSEKSRRRFVDPMAPGTFCIGGRDECDAFSDHGTRIAWSQAPAPEQYPDIQVLHLRPTPRQAKNASLPEYVRHLPNLWMLAFPAPYLEALQSDDLPPATRSLSIDLDPRWGGDSGESLPNWPATVIQPGITGIRFHGTYGSSMFWTKLGLLPHHVPKLTFFESDLDPKGEGIDHLARFPRLRHLELSQVRDFDPFVKICTPIEILSLNSSGRNFPVQNIVHWTTLRAVALIGIKAEIDCRVFRRLPELVELEFVGCKKLLHLEALLECERLQYLDLTNCGHPFKRDLASTFKARGFNRLNIQYA